MLDRSSLLSAWSKAGWVHGFTTRHGGVSRGSHASLNVSAKRGDSESKVEENLRRIAQRAGFEREKLARVRQVHGACALHVASLGPEAEADAIWMGPDDGPFVVSVTTADCVPVLLLEPEAGLAAAVHAGWRGVVAGVVPATVEAMGAKAAGLLAAIGPCIETAAFEVGEEVAAQFAEKFVSRAHGPKAHVDLVAAVREQLEDLGVPAKQIERVGGCTYATPERYFSYRRDGASTGQALSFIGKLPG